MGIEEKVGEELFEGAIKGNLAWRLIVSGSLGVIMLWILWAVGMFASIGLPSKFALADDAKDVKQQLAQAKDQVAEIRASLLAEKIDAVTTSLCMTSYDTQLLSYRATLQKDYRQITGSEHMSPPCEVLLKLNTRR